ncbi:VOC family protein [Marinomonas mediterranea]|jgi:Glyoxalase/Bleomycin resistance protein/Dioxygenase superfamily.|uniref:Glyoxalase/bleomycin resistance protein/dioxygenase n=1 Tax=Marinomonas mediterranea (strain ATCC 700492 / JCM 21426 / NBRC 103028 / MMB-1) TaxID=717774 RepID=F2JWW6_MARM1|nr:VOC family protein [Marinomonas mediterranea]ADZ92983.1 Glyoxalase/bleomycin resistance protein/dioxygenase [Marinomonas mediterranea MMB-1]WCN10896.1 glyoxalase [Marinomonas mediterranea]WCN14957.1 glyoxalase [Marinomonas mediterranea]WCN19002.1 glyoxalase [Marinomonas mediterranea MMB-1]
MITIRRPNLQLIYVSDIKQSTHYYQMIFNIEPYFITPRYVVFNIDGEANFAIWSGAGEPDKDAPRYSEIGMCLNSDKEVKELYSEWEANTDINIHTPLHTDVFGETFLVKDPDGHLIRISSAD